MLEMMLSVDMIYLKMLCSLPHTGHAQLVCVEVNSNLFLFKINLDHIFVVSLLRVALFWFGYLRFYLVNQ